MKKFKALAIIASFLLVYTGSVSGQEYKLDLSSGKIRINEVHKVTIEGHNENFVLISTTDRGHHNSERARGLRPINSLGLEDNSGIGLAVDKTGNEVEINSVSRHRNSRYTILVPKDVTISYQNSSNHGGPLQIKNVQSELDVTVRFNSVHLENVSGPMTINTVHGKIEAVFSQVSQKSPISLVSAHGLIDVALPADTKAKLRLSSDHGEIFSDMKIEYEKSGGLHKISSSHVNGSLNGGGIDIRLSSNHGNIYLRTKK
ncbi:DUF4097 family beta strand repeat-containing protein [Fulvivirgaceae bacterium BMA12]|uniref:DUF4097 family beta strand repeat-containing protein n=1 Tax=Agaribacillus aureus TaxID=3051825 RepID=A0ABT8LCV3_9BACT|nr:DUF4097 family beta strand repeat-containing protein [Fulvivirgaceae bacterium BMA12]